MARRPRYESIAIAGVAALVAAAIVVMLIAIGDREQVGEPTDPTPSSGIGFSGPTDSPPEPPPSADPSPPLFDPLLLSTERHGELAMAVDADGHAHIVVNRAKPNGYQGSDGLWHFTDASGSWEEEQLTTSVRIDLMHADPALAVDSDGSLWVAYAEQTETGSMGIFVLSNRSGAWSAPALAADCNCTAPALAASDGIVHLAAQQNPVFEQPGDASIVHLTNAGGSWTSSRISEGVAPALALKPDGLPVIGFIAADRVQLAEADASGAFTLHAGSGPSSFSFAPRLAFRADGTLDAVWADGTGVFWAQRRGSEWTVPETLAANVTDAEARGLAIGSDGAVHAVATGWQEGVWYISGRTGEFAARQLASGHSAGAAVALDLEGRPRVAYVVGSGYEPGFGLTQAELWYGI